MPMCRGALWFSTVPRNAVLPSSEWKLQDDTFFHFPSKWREPLTQRHKSSDRGNPVWTTVMPGHGKKYKPMGSGFSACAYWQSINAMRRQRLSVVQITQHRWWIERWMRMEQWRDDSVRRRQKCGENPVPVPLPPPQIPHRPAWEPSDDSSGLQPAAYLLYRLRHFSRPLLSFLSPSVHQMMLAVTTVRASVWC
jgi:hypothetical protein